MGLQQRCKNVMHFEKITLKEEKRRLKSTLRCKLLRKRSAVIVITLLVIIVDNDENARLASKRSSFLL